MTALNIRQLVTEAKRYHPGDPIVPGDHGVPAYLDEAPPSAGTTETPGRAGAASWPVLDLAALAARDPEPPRHIIPAWLPEGEVTLLAGHGGAGKSAIALHLGACIALGRPWCGLDVAQRHVTYISTEDGADIMHWRLTRITRHMGIVLGDLCGHLDVIDATGIDPELMAEIGRGEEPILTAHYLALVEGIAPGGVVMLDGASDVYGASEIVRRHVRRFVRALRRLAGEHGAVLLLAHVDKAAARNRDNGDRYSGSTAWHNSVRARWELRSEPDSDELVLALAKANHARAGAEIRLGWDDVAHMHLPTAGAADGGIVASIRERTEQDGILAALRACAAAGLIVPAAMQGPRTAYHVLSERPELPGSMRSGRDAGRRFRAALERLRHIGAVEERDIRRGNRHYTLALVLADRGSAPHASHSD